MDSTKNYREKLRPAKKSIRPPTTAGPRTLPIPPKIGRIIKKVQEEKSQQHRAVNKIKKQYTARKSSNREHHDTKKRKIGISRFQYYCIPRSVLKAVVKGVVNNMEDMKSRSLKISFRGLEGFQAALEDYTIDYFRKAFKCAQHARRKTLTTKDMQLVSDIQGLNIQLPMRPS